VPVLLVVLFGACVDPEQRFNDYASRIVDARVVVQPDVPPFETIPDVSGTFLTGLTADILAGGPRPIPFLSTQTVDKRSGKYMLTLSLQPLDKTTRLPVGSPIGYAPVEVAANGSFNASVASLTIPAAANTLAPIDIVADSIVIHGQILTANAHCGTLDGNVTSPAIGSLAAQHTTYGAIRVAPGTMGNALPPPPKNCATPSPAAGGP